MSAAIICGHLPGRRAQRSQQSVASGPDVCVHGSPGSRQHHRWQRQDDEAQDDEAGVVEVTLNRSNGIEARFGASRR